MDLGNQRRLRGISRRNRHLDKNDTKNRRKDQSQCLYSTSLKRQYFRPQAKERSASKQHNFIPRTAGYTALLVVQKLSEINTPLPPRVAALHLPQRLAQCLFDKMLMRGLSFHYMLAHFRNHSSADASNTKRLMLLLLNFWNPTPVGAYVRNYPFIGYGLAL